ncbi:MAG: amidase [Cyanophyceae cyanobacterium]
MPTQTVDLAYLSAAEAGQLFRKRELSPVELTQALLKRIEATQPTLQAFITVTEELALEQAKAAEAAIQQGDPRPLLGIPIGHKDIILTEGILTTGGSALLQDWIPDKNAEMVTRLDAAGMVTLGKLSTFEFASGLSTLTDHPFPSARNPWNPDHVPGGSSSGSGAALAAGLTVGALGTDTGGSIRWPGAACGIAALKPTYGRCSRYGVLSLSWSLDHIGPMARTTEDVALMLEVMAGYDPKDPASATVPVGDYTSQLKSGVKGLKLGVLRSWYEANSTPEVLAAMTEALQVLTDLGAELVDVEIPHLDLMDGATLISLAEAYAYHAKDLKEHPELYLKPLQNRFKVGGLISAEEYLNAQRARSIVKAEVDGILKGVDALISPTWGDEAISFEKYYQNHAVTFPGPSFTRLFNVTGSPAISIPCGFGSQGLPLGLQIAGRAFDEATVLRISHAYEQATPWHQKHPSI